MARIRSIKPEFWTSEQVVECSPTARLLFIGLWNFCDDYGAHPYAPKTIKMQIFPGDSFKIEQIEGWLSELIVHGLVKTYHVEDIRYLLITGWHHQRIEKPNRRYPEPILFDDQSANDRRPVGDSSPPEGKGRERKGRDIETKTPLPEDFGISDPVKSWAKKKGLNHLDEHLEAFKRKCRAKGYKYIDWDAAFMEAIRENWAKIDNGNGNGGARPKSERCPTQEEELAEFNERWKRDNPDPMEETPPFPPDGSKAAM